jgi:hypothetical protein
VTDHIVWIAAVTFKMIASRVQRPDVRVGIVTALGAGFGVVQFEEFLKTLRMAGPRELQGTNARVGSTTYTR